MEVNEVKLDKIDAVSLSRNFRSLARPDATVDQLSLVTRRNEARLAFYGVFRKSGMTNDDIKNHKRLRAELIAISRILLSKSKDRLLIKDLEMQQWYWERWYYETTDPYEIRVNENFMRKTLGDMHFLRDSWTYGSQHVLRMLDIRYTNILLGTNVKRLNPFIVSIMCGGGLLGTTLSLMMGNEGDHALIGNIRHFDPYSALPSVTSTGDIFTTTADVELIKRAIKSDRNILIVDDDFLTKSSMNTVINYLVMNLGAKEGRINTIANPTPSLS